MATFRVQREYRRFSENKSFRVKRVMFNTADNLTQPVAAVGNTVANTANRVAGGAIGGTAGAVRGAGQAIGGTLKGAATGAALGSIVPVVGTAIGAGNLIGATGKTTQEMSYGGTFKNAGWDIRV
jgi:hypothetical protein